MKRIIAGMALTGAVTFVGVGPAAAMTNTRELYFPIH